MKTTISSRQAALIAGWGLFFMTFFAIYPFNFIFPNLIVSEDAGMTVKNISENELQFRIGICSYLIVIILDVLVAWALYVFLKPINMNISLLTAWFRLIYAAIYGVALANYFHVLKLLSSTEFLNILGTDQFNVQIMLSLNAFHDTWAMGLVLFGLHLVLLGYLALKSAYVPKILGILLTIAGASYLIDYATQFLFPGINFPISTYLGWGELIFMFWLLYKGGKKLSYETE